MSGEWGQSDLLTLPRDEEQVNEGEYLSTLSPRHKPWETHRAEADEVQQVYAGGAARHQRYAERVAGCAQVLEFARDPPAQNSKQKLKLKLKLKHVWFCRVRHCPVCQWRRSLMWQARVYLALPQLIKDYPHIRFLFLTLTIRNCQIQNLRATLKLLALGWKRLADLPAWPAQGWVRSVEITRGKDGSAHPHYHCLLVVPPSYFQGEYLQQKQWAELWRHCLGIDYTPVVDVRVVQPEQRLASGKIVPATWNMWGAVVEILKYAVKPSDMVRDHEWFLQLTDQIQKTRAVAVGGILKRYIKERERENLTKEPGEEEAMTAAERLFFGWKHEVKRYRKMG
jgi:plasmid rolling circle replication initiator protein Rep